ncbi:uncharacterized protein LOC128841123 isoform X2 [Malaclemys terrapin pileata]|uniref:uncharacterized protein LOC128841123 isoform X2 n=1 Tax=Malaclemys terrapin pileata TaxID=2991368 RepID=UPI0023A7E2F6|nr:uncharacterized protein LOC128841123 isoform X2 [Malaclemys terrapin pileata]
MVKAGGLEARTPGLYSQLQKSCVSSWLKQGGRLRVRTPSFRTCSVGGCCPFISLGLFQLRMGLDTTEMEPEMSTYGPFYPPCSMEAGDPVSTQGPYAALGQPCWGPEGNPAQQGQQPRAAGGPYGLWPQRIEPAHRRLDPFAQAFPNLPFGKPWVLGTQASRSQGCSLQEIMAQPPPIAPQEGYPPGSPLLLQLPGGQLEGSGPPLSYCSLPERQGQGGGGYGQQRKEPPLSCLYQENQSASYSPPEGYPGPAPQGLAGPETYAGLLGPPDWLPDAAPSLCCYQDTERYCKGLEFLPAGFAPWPGVSPGDPDSEVAAARLGHEQSPPLAGHTATPQVSGSSLASSYRGTPYWSRMHWARGPPHYTPPPMLNPLRRGTGLFAELSASLGGGSPDPLQHLDTPQINVGPAFQPALPVLRDPHLAQLDPPQAELAWRPWPGLEQDAETQRQVETLLDVACSSALPGGGTNQELALHCLCQAGGNVMVALETLLLRTPVWPKCHPLASYHYTGSDVWSTHERRLFSKAFALHRKDFAQIQRAPPPTPELPQDSPPGSSFPCKRCGKTFYKIKSRNAHMKIHRQQDDWGGQGGMLGPGTLPAPHVGCPPWANTEPAEPVAEALACPGLGLLYGRDMEQLFM